MLERLDHPLLLILALVLAVTAFQVFIAWGLREAGMLGPAEFFRPGISATCDAASQ